MAVKQVTKMDVDGSMVELRVISNDIIIRYGDKARSIYEAYVDDVMRGYVYFPNGWGGTWHLLSLRPQSRYDPGYHKHDHAEIHAYGIEQFYRQLSPGSLNETEDWGEHKRRWTDRNEIMAALPKIVALGRAPSPAEFDAQLVQDKIDYKLHKEQDARDAAQREIERGEREAERVAAGQRAEELRLETLEGLESIRDRLGTEISNHEMVALTRAIEKFGGARA